MREKMARGMWSRRYPTITWPELKSLTADDLAKLDTTACRMAGEVFNEVDACLDALMEPTEGMLKAIDVKLHPSWLGHRAYELMIRAAKEGK